MKNSLQKKISKNIYSVFSEHSSVNDLIIHSKSLQKEILEVFVSIWENVIDSVKELTPIDKGVIKKRTLLLQGASLNLLNKVIALLSAFPEKPIRVILASLQYIIDRIVITEASEIYREQLLANYPDSKFIWVLKDKCSKCSKYSNKEFTAENFPPLPHIGCKCYPKRKK